MNTDKITTKKLLVAYDPSNPEGASSDFLVPIADSTPKFLLGLKSKKKHDHGVMVYLGRAVAVNDVFAKLVDTGRKIESVSQTVNVLEAYFQMLQEFHIDNILALEACTDLPCGFRLKRIANSRPVKPLNLP